MLRCIASKKRICAWRDCGERYVHLAGAWKVELKIIEQTGKEEGGIAFVRLRIRPAIFFFSLPSLHFLSFFFFHSGNGEVKTRERFCRNFNYFLLTPCRGYLCNTAGPPAWFRSSDRRVNSTQDLLRPFYTGSHNM